MRLVILSAALFLSGISALIFETLWLRLSGLAFGNSVWTAALILSTFMAGLALGTAIAASSKLHSVRPLRFYAGLEIAIALLGCTIVFALPHLGTWLRPVFQLLWNHQSLLLALRGFISFLLLLVPTTAMGLSLPVVLEDPAIRKHEFGRAIGILYGCNTLGAVAGALLGEACLIKAFGLWGTSVAAGMLNCVAAGIALLVGKLTARSTSLRAGLSATEANGMLTASPTGAKPRWLRLEISYNLPWRLLFVGFGSGCILLCLEVVWFRFLRLYVASSPIAFCIMLAVVLAGIGLGGALSGALPGSGRSQSWLTSLLMLAATVTLLSYTFFPIPKLHVSEANFYYEDWLQIALLSLALMFPTALISGALFPTIAAGVQTTVGNRMNSAGLATLFNTAGAAVGPLLAAFLFLPKIGFQTSLVVCAAGYALLGLVIANKTLRGSRSQSLVALLFFLTWIVALFTFPFHRDQVHFANARRLYETEGQHLVRKIEGTSDTWQLLRRDHLGQPYYYRLLTNGFSMSATSPRNQRYMRLFAYLPIALQGHANNALLIAYGCGVTADALTHDADLKHIDVVDISKEVFALAPDYRGAGYSNPLEDSRVTPIIQDGRFLLQAGPQHYDIITGEPPPPKVAGSVNLYTEQFFALMRDRLGDGGIATFWLPIYQLNVEETKSILRAFHDAFPNTLIWSSSDEEWIMMGIKGEPRKVDDEQVRKLWDDPKTRADLARIGIEVPEQLAALFLMDGEEIDRITAGSKPLTDFYPKRLGDTTSEDTYIHGFALSYINAVAAAAHFQASRLIRQIWPDVSVQSLQAFFVIREMRFRANMIETNWLAELDLHLRGSRLQEPVLETMQSDPFRVTIAQKVADDLHPPPADALPDLIAAALSRRDFSAAIQLMEDKRGDGNANRDDLCLLTYLYCLSGNVDKAQSVAAVTPNSNGPFVKWLWDKLKAEYGFQPPE